MGEKKEVYRRFIQGKASEAEVREIFGDDFEDFEDRRELVTMMEETPNRPPSNRLFD